MNSALGKMLWFYVARSWLSTVYIGGCFVIFIVMMIMQELAVGLWVFELFMAIVVVSSRLKATRTYALGFMAPGYRRRQFTLAMVLLMLLGWTPMLLTSDSFYVALQLLTLAVIGSGLMLIVDHMDTRLFGYVSMFIGIAVVGMLFVGISVRWDPPPVLMMVLLPVGSLLLAAFRQRFLDGAEYDPTLAAASEVQTGSGWVVTHRPHQADVSVSNPLWRWLARTWIDDNIKRLKAGGRESRLLSFGAGDMMFWRAGWLAIIAMGLFSTIMAIPMGAQRASEVLPHVVAAIVVMMAGGLAIGYAGSVRWPLGPIWLRSSVADKGRLVRVMAGEMARHIAINLLGALLLASAIAIASISHGLGAAPGEWLSFLGCVAAIAVGIVVQGVGQALNLRRFESVGTIINWMSLLIWGLTVAVLAPVFTSPWVYSGTVFAVGVSWGGLLIYWWYGWFYERRGYALVD